jgi:predicted PurR-regulated permease PerM
MYCMTGRLSGEAGDEPVTADGDQLVVTGGEHTGGEHTGEQPVVDEAGGELAEAAAQSPPAGSGQPGASFLGALRRIWRPVWLLAGSDSGAVAAASAAAAGTAAGGQAEADAEAEVEPALRSPDSQVPRLLRQSAAWSWRLLLTGLVIYLAFRLAEHLRLVVLPFIAAMLLCALLQPLAAWLRRRGMSDLASTWCAFGLMIVVIGGAGWLVVTQISDTYPVLFSEVQKTADQLQRSLAGPPFHLNASRLSKLSTDILNYISQHKSVVAGTVLTGGKYALEFLAGIVLTLFISFFLIKDGRRIWRFLISGMRPEARRRAANAGDAGWRALVHYIRGTTVVAAIHALFIGLALWLLGVPLLVPLIVLVFLAAFIPIIGILVVGALAILVALATKGWVAAVILLGVFLLENQIESHLLQPLVMGRIIRLHPLAIILVLAVGGIIAGIPGAIIAVPVAAVITYAWPELRNGQPPS